MNETTCDCCEGIEKLTPQSIVNRPGLDALRYRVGTHSTFLKTMLAALSRQEYRVLSNLTTRETDDPAIALLDAGATLLDVLTFYQERIANEGYLRTATEYRSLLEIARLIGYKLRPGVASSVYLAFTLENGYEVEIPAGTRSQSIPLPGELPQSFETAEKFLARSEWNALQPRLTRPMYITLGNAPGLDTLYFRGTAINLNPNAPLLLVFSDESEAQVLHFVESVAINAAGNYTAVRLLTPLTPTPVALVDTVRATAMHYLDLDAFGVSAGTKMAKHVTGLLKDIKQRLSPTITGEEVASLLDEILPALREEHARAIEGGFERLEPWVGNLVKSLESIEVQRMRNVDEPERVAARNAAIAADGRRRSPFSRLEDMLPALLRPSSLQPRNSIRLARDYKSLFSTQSDTIPRFLTAFRPQLKGMVYQAWARAEISPDTALRSANALRIKAAPFGYNAQPQPDGTVEWPLSEQPSILVLDGEYDQIKPGSWVAIQRPPAPIIPLHATAQLGVQPETIGRKVNQVRTIFRNAYGLSGKATELTLDAEWCEEALANLQTTWFLRNTTVYAQSEPLLLAEEPVWEDVAGDTLELGALYNGLETGRWVIVSGERTDIPSTTGVQASELVMLSGITQGVAQIDIGNETIIDLPGDKVHTTLHFANDLAYTYKRDTVKVYGNVVKATHGETRRDVLGSGDARQALQSFELRQSPLTYTSAPTPSGVASSLVVRVNDVRWPEVDSLIWLDRDERGYITRTDDEDKTSILFGDGEYGARLPTGVENIEATYRFGIGKPGNVQPGQISQLITKPLGVKSVSNPLRATGGADRDDSFQVRENAPLAVMALDRLVSVQDFADFLRNFAGVGKASAARLSDGRRQFVHVTIAGVDDIPIDETSDLYQNLRLAFQRFSGDPFQPVMLAVRDLKLLVIVARVRLLPDYEWESVEPAIRASLLDTFSFDRRQLGEAVYSGRVISTIQAVPGVAYVDLEILDAVTEKTTPAELEHLAETLALQDHIPVHLARPDPNQITAPRPILPAQIAYLSPEIPDTLILTELIV